MQSSTATLLHSPKDLVLNVENLENPETKDADHVSAVSGDDATDKSLNC